MSDENAGQPDPNLDAAQGPGGAPMMMVNAQYVKDLSFENPNAPQSLSQQGEPNVQIAIDVNAEQVADKAFEVSLTLRAEGTAGESQLFIVEIAYAGIFSLGEVPDEYVPPLLYIEAPRQLFPFARAIVADAVRDGGFPPLLMQPVDFMSMYQQRVAQAQAEAGEAPEGGDGGGGNGGDDKQKFEFEL
ncbi:MAG: protein-export chaperone SecB [Alphaproteobacteria bacterium]|mgnify:CR=1 FL=1|nr:protein-export chaperone SecB [Alphaproteobacteria bacterium]|tara:strand:+ start:1905 stop:2468 length:564 start_codon:yes stop_codon:yes gene_type:complete